MSAGYRKAAPRRTHRERGQLRSRRHLGHLEKHKDYVARAKRYHVKQDMLKKLSSKARLRNPDEFSMKMVNAKVRQGVHVHEAKAKEAIQDGLTSEQRALVDSHDKKYVAYLSSINRSKMQKLAKECGTNKMSLKKTHIIFDSSSISSSNNVKPISKAQDCKSSKSSCNSLRDQVLRKISTKKSARRLLQGEEVNAQCDFGVPLEEKSSQELRRELRARKARAEALAEVEGALETRRHVALARGRKFDVVYDQKRQNINVEEDVEADTSKSKRKQKPVQPKMQIKWRTERLR